MKIFIHKYKSELSTIFGLITAIANAWMGIDWTNFVLNKSNIMVLLLSAVVAIGGYKTSINLKNNENG